jgi:hypothetical protein
VTERKRLAAPRPKPTKQDLLARLKGATRKGRPNKVNVMFKQALLLAPDIKGYDKMGTGGLVGWLLKQAEDYPETYLKMLVKALTPIEVQMLTLQQNNQVNVAEPSQGWHTSKEAIMAASIEDIRTSINRTKTSDLRAMLQALTNIQGAMKGRANDPVLKRLDAPHAETIEAEPEQHEPQ